MRPELKIVLVAVEIIVVIAAALALEQCGTGSENSDKGYISGEYSGGAQENIDYEAKTVAIDSGHGGIDPGKISADGILVGLAGGASVPGGLTAPAGILEHIQST